MNYQPLLYISNGQKMAMLKNAVNLSKIIVSALSSICVEHVCNGVLFLPVYSNMSHDIMVPLVWASTVTSSVDIFSHFYLIPRHCHTLQ